MKKKNSGDHCIYNNILSYQDCPVYDDLHLTCLDETEANPLVIFRALM